MKPKTPPATPMFQNGEDLPLFSGVPERASIKTYTPTEQATRIPLPGFELEVGSKKFAIKPHKQELA